MSETAQGATYINIQCSQRIASQFKEQHHIHSAVLANRKEEVNTNWPYYKFHFKLGINTTHPSLYCKSFIRNHLRSQHIIIYEPCELFFHRTNLILSSKCKCFSANKLFTNLETLIIKFVTIELTTTYVWIK